MTYARTCPDRKFPRTSSGLLARHSHLQQNCNRVEITCFQTSEGSDRRASFMRSQACVPCAKRKIRCNREEPCFNCQRKQQECVYPDDHSNERIKQLEALVRRLGGDPDILGHDIETPSQVKSTQPNKHDARLDPGEEKSDSMIVQEQDESLYLET